MNRLEDHQHPCDVTLVVNNVKQFKAHRSVLSEASPFFEKLLNSDMKEANEGVIRLEAIEESQMADILAFIYTGDVPFATLESAENLIEMADYLLLSKLKVIAGLFLEQHMTTLNCISIYYLAEIYLCEDLIDSSKKFIQSNFKAVAASDDFLSLPSHEVEKWISSNEITIDAEENVYEIILRWIDNDKSERSVKFCELFRHVRLTCVSRDYLANDVLTNELVKENQDCLDTVIGALKWIDRPTDCDVPRPHSPRYALETNAIVITTCGYKQPFHTSFYLPATDEWYHLPANECEPRFVVSCRGKVFVVTTNIVRSLCYDPDLNCWFPAPWTELESNRKLFIYLSYSHQLIDVLIVRTDVCFIVAEGGSVSLWRYNLDSNLTSLLFYWLKKQHFCAIPVGRFIYVVGGRVAEYPDSFHQPGGDLYPHIALSECSRFDTEGDKWQQIAHLQEARRETFGASKGENIFIAGGLGISNMRLNTCELYNVLTDEWQFIASLNVGRTLGKMVLVQETLFVIGGFKSTREYSDTVECYDHGRDEWKEAVIPIEKVAVEGVPWLCSFMYLKASSLRLFSGVLNKLARF